MHNHSWESLVKIMWLGLSFHPNFKKYYHYIIFSTKQMLKRQSNHLQKNRSAETSGGTRGGRVRTGCEQCSWLSNRSWIVAVFIVSNTEHLHSQNSMNRNPSVSRRLGAFFLLVKMKACLEKHIEHPIHIQASVPTHPTKICHWD